MRKIDGEWRMWRDMDTPSPDADKYYEKQPRGVVARQPTARSPSSTIQRHIRRSTSMPSWGMVWLSPFGGRTAERHHSLHAGEREQVAQSLAASDEG